MRLRSPRLTGTATSDEPDNAMPIELSLKRRRWGSISDARIGGGSAGVPYTCRYSAYCFNLHRTTRSDTSAGVDRSCNQSRQAQAPYTLRVNEVDRFESVCSGIRYCSKAANGSAAKRPCSTLFMKHRLRPSLMRPRMRGRTKLAPDAKLALELVLFHHEERGAHASSES